MISLFIFILLIFCNYRYKYKIIIFTPVLLTLSETLFIFLPGAESNSNAIIITNLILFNSIVLNIFYIIKIRNKSTKILTWVIIFIIYVLILVPQSSDIWWSFKRTIGVISALLFLVSSFKIVSDKKDFLIVYKSAFIVVIIFLINITICSLFKIGNSGYNSDLIYLGSVNFFGAYGFVYSVAFIFIFKKEMKYNAVSSILVPISLFILILITKRTYIYILVLVSGIFYLNTFRLSLKKIVYLAIVILLGLTLGLDLLIDRLESRRDRFNTELFEEGRVIEYFAYLNVLNQKSNNVNFLLFGEELFNSQGKFNFFSLWLNDKDRLLHSDYVHILYGSGIIGLGIYLIIFINLYRDSRILKEIKSSYQYRNYFIAFFAIYFALILNGFGDGLLIPTNRMIPFLFLGSILGFLRSELNYK